MPDRPADGAPTLSPDTAPDMVFEQFLDAGVLAFQRCTACTHAVFPPRVLCPACGDPRLEWQNSSGEGVVYSVTTLAPRGHEPYAVALVDLDEGFRMLAEVDAEPDAVHVGMQVEVGWEDHDEIAIPVFRPVRTLGT